MNVNIIQGSPEFKPSVIRPLGKMERAMWMFDQASPANICVGCHLHGEITDQAVITALRWSQTRHPLLRSVIVSRAGALHFACHSVEQAPDISLDICTGSPADEDRVVLEEMRKPLSGFDGIMMRVKLMRFSPQHCYLNVVYSHVIGDGFSGILVMRDIIHILAHHVNQTPYPTPVPLTFPVAAEQGITPQFSGFNGIKKFFGFQKRIVNEVFKFGADLSPVRIENNLPYSQRGIQFKGFSLTTAETSVLVERARQEKVTVYALLSAMILDAFYPVLESTQKSGLSPLRLVSMAAPVDLRHFLSTAAKDHFCFYSAAVNGLYKLDSVNNISHLAKQLHTDIRRSVILEKSQLYINPVIAKIIGGRWFFPVNAKGVRRIARVTEKMFKSSATSLTFISNPDIDKEIGKLSVSCARGHISPSIMGVALYSVILYHNELTVYLNYNESQLSDDDAELLIKRFKSHILEKT
jgi:hypothetical protein